MKLMEQVKNELLHLSSEKALVIEPRVKEIDGQGLGDNEEGGLVVTLVVGPEGARNLKMTLKVDVSI